MYAGIELGGTNINCVVGNSAGEVVLKYKIATTDPKKSFSEIKNYFDPLMNEYQFKGVGVASFGPLDLNASSSKFGHIKQTPKEFWSDFNLLAGFQNIFKNTPININTDVNGAAVAESLWGIGENIDTFIYLTIGTGIGGAIVVENELHQGNMHPEIGHMLLPRLASDKEGGVCSFHDNCWEGFASGPAIEARWGIKAIDIPAKHPAWDMEAEYIALGLANLYFSLGISNFILGGGVTNQTLLFPKIKNKFIDIVNNYMGAAKSVNIFPSNLHPSAGMVGALALAIQAK